MIELTPKEQRLLIAGHRARDKNNNFEWEVIATSVGLPRDEGKTMVERFQREGLGWLHGHQKLLRLKNAGLSLAMKLADEATFGHRSKVWGKVVAVWLLNHLASLISGAIGGAITAYIVTRYNWK